MTSLTGKVALITGASSGIGAATAIHFASLGCSVAINGRNIEKLNEISTQCLSQGLLDSQVLIVVGDIGKDENAIDIVSKTISHFGKLDVLVNNAGICKRGFLEKGSLENFDEMINTNLRGAFHLTQLCAPHLKKTKGNIVNVSSVASHLYSVKLIAYSSSKAGLDHISRTTAFELAKDQIRVNAINPGAIATDIFSHMGIPKNDLEGLEEKLARFSLLGTVGKCKDIAKSIAFLASDDASFITGATLLVDGGMHLMGPEFTL